MTKITDISSESIDEISDHDYIRKYCKQMLKNSIFIGTFQEKRFVEPLKSYRDVISVSRDEGDFIQNLLVVKRKIDEGFLRKPWIGITEPDTIGVPIGYCLWVELKEEVFGRYWYKVRTVEFLQNEIKLKLEVIRPVKCEGPSLGNTSSNDETTTMPNIQEFDFVTCIKQISVVLKLNLLYFYNTILTFENIKHSVIFISVLIGVMVTGGVSIIKYLLEYLLKLIREFSSLVKAVTPILTTFINLIGRIVFGFYSVILTMWRGNKPPQPVYNSYINFDPQVVADLSRWNLNAPRQLKYYPDRVSGPTITALNE